MLLRLKLQTTGSDGGSWVSVMISSFARACAFKERLSQGPMNSAKDGATLTIGELAREIGLRTFRFEAFPGSRGERARCSAQPTASPASALGVSRS
jgi:hypothetical protein